MTIFHSHRFNVVKRFKVMGQLLRLFILGAGLLMLSLHLVVVSGQWGWLAFGVMMGSLPFIGFYLAVFLLAPKHFHPSTIWKPHSSSLVFGVVMVCALSGYLSMGELNRVPDPTVAEPSLSEFEKLLMSLSAFTLLTCVYMPLRALSLFHCLGMTKTNSLGELFKQHNEDLFHALAIPSFPTGIVLFLLLYYSLAAMSHPSALQGHIDTFLFLFEIIAAFNVAYLCVNREKSGVHTFTQPSV